MFTPEMMQAMLGSMLKPVPAAVAAVPAAPAQQERPPQPQYGQLPQQQQQMQMQQQMHMHQQMHMQQQMFQQQQLYQQQMHAGGGGLLPQPQHQQHNQSHHASQPRALVPVPPLATIGTAAYPAVSAAPPGAGAVAPQVREYNG